MKKILIIEDDRQLAGSLYTLLSTQFAVVLAANEKEIYSRLEKYKFDVIVTDRMLQAFDTLELVTYIRTTFIDTKLICISQLSTHTEKIKGLQVGFDDYLPKPFSLKELEIKIHKLIALQRIKVAECVDLGDVQYFPDNGILKINGIPSQLRRKEYELFNCLVRHRNQLVKRETLFNAGWNQDQIPSDVTLDVYIRKLRVKLLDYSSIIKTIRGYGYVLSCETEE